MQNRPGYFRIIANQHSEIMAYSEFYERGAEFAEAMKKQAENGRIRLVCACCSDKELSLSITQKGVLRVAENSHQAVHAENCPKSVYYNRWLSQNESGLYIADNNQLIFNITMPGDSKSESSSSGSSNTETKEKKNAKEHASIVDMMSKVNALALEKQTFSIKKQIGVANKENRKPEWNYKSIQDFNKLIYGVSNDVLIHIKVQSQPQLIPLVNLYYKKDIFYKASYKNKFLIYARVLRLAKFNEDRKYQYITVQMPSNKSAYKAVIRILTEDYKKVLGDNEVPIEEDIKEPDNYVLTGYVRHDMYQAKDTNEETHWITFIKGKVIRVSNNGFYCRHSGEQKIYDELAKRHIVFKRPLVPIKEYDNSIPTLIIERRNKATIVVDICKSGQELSKKEEIASADKSGLYRYVLRKKRFVAKDVIDEIFDILRKE